MNFDMNKKIVLSTKIEDSILFYILLIMSCANFFGRGSLVCFFCAIYVSLKTLNKLTLNIDFICSLLLSLSIALASIAYYDITETIKAINYVLMYLIGYNAFLVSENKIVFLRKTIFSIFGGFFLNVILTYVYNCNLGIYEGNQRQLYNVW